MIFYFSMKDVIMMNDEIRQLVKRVIAKDESAFLDLYNAYYSIVFDYAMQICKNHADANDVTQETFLSIHKHIHKLKEIEAFPYWVKRIVISKCNRIFRKKKLIYMESSDLIQVEKNEDFYQSNFEKQMQNKFEKEELYKILQTLKKEHREVLEYVYLKQMKYDEVANILGIPEGTVKSRTIRAKAILLDKIKAYEEENQRKVAFHQKGIFAGIFTLSFITSIRKKLKRKFNPVHLQYVSLTAVIILSGVAGYEVLQIDNHHFSLASSEHVEETKQISDNNFEPVLYDGNYITNSKDAYYICLRELVKEDMQEHLEKLKPVYLSLKKSNDQYYQLFVKEDMEKWFR